MRCLSWVRDRNTGLKALSRCSRPFYRETYMFWSAMTFIGWWLILNKVLKALNKK